MFILGESNRNLLLGLACNETIGNVLLDLSNNILGNGGCHVLESCIHGVRCLSTLDISDNGIDVEMAGVLLAICRNKSLKHLVLNKNFQSLKSKHAATVIDAFVHLLQEEDCVIETLGLIDCKLKSELYSLINAVGSNQSLIHLDLTWVLCSTVAEIRILLCSSWHHLLEQNLIVFNSVALVFDFFSYLLLETWTQSALYMWLKKKVVNTSRKTVSFYLSKCAILLLYLTFVMMFIGEISSVTLELDSYQRPYRSTHQCRHSPSIATVSLFTATVISPMLLKGKMKKNRINFLLVIRLWTGKTILVHSEIACFIKSLQKEKKCLAKGNQ